MTYQCDPCACPEQHYRDNGSFKKAVITLLCRSLDGLADILIAISGGTPTPSTHAVFPVLASLAYGSIIIGYTAVVDLPDDTRQFTLDNQTNGDVYVSMDAGWSTTYHLKGGDKLVVSLADLGLITTAVVSVRYGIGGASSSGAFYVYSIH
jgi:hypothetical protein